MVKSLVYNEEDNNINDENWNDLKSPLINFKNSETCGTWRTSQIAYSKPLSSFSKYPKVYFSVLK